MESGFVFPLIAMLPFVPVMTAMALVFAEVIARPVRCLIVIHRQMLLVVPIA